MRKPSIRQQKGAFLLEALIALLIFSVGILGVMGLQATALKNTSDAKYRADASFLANQIIGQMWADKADLSSYATPTAWLARVASTLPQGTGTIVLDVDPNTGSQRTTVTVNWQLPGDDPHRFVAIAQINGAT